MMMTENSARIEADIAQDREWAISARKNYNGLGTRLFVWIISKFGLIPAYFVLVFASIQYSLLDKKSKLFIKEFRHNIGLKTSPVDFFRHFYAFGMSLIDRYSYLLSSKDLFSYKRINESVIRENVERGKGVILLGSHTGNWELAGNVLQKLMTVPINILMLDVETPEAKLTLEKVTGNRSVKVIFIDNESPDTMIQIVKALKNGEVISFHGDRIVEGQRSEEVNFFGKKALFPSGPFSIAAMTGAVIIPFFAMKTGMLEYTFTAFDPITVDNSDRQQRPKNIRRAVEKYVGVLENMATKHPCQWFNFFKFWLDK
jgi:predicted LPLAT superfamily acyltransferase